MDEKSDELSIENIDHVLARINTRLTTVASDLHDGLFGESQKTEDCDKSEMETPSLKSFVRRISDAEALISEIERYVTNIHKPSH